MILVDSSVWIDHFRGRLTDKVILLREMPPEDILVADLVLLELLQGTRDDRHAQRLASLMAQFHVASIVDAARAVSAARKFRYLRGMGITIRRTVDLLIATYCIENEHVLLQADRDFAPFATHFGLKLA